MEVAADLAAMLNYTTVRVPVSTCPALDCPATLCVNGSVIRRDANGW